MQKKDAIKWATKPPRKKEKKGKREREKDRNRLAKKKKLVQILAFAHP